MGCESTLTRMVGLREFIAVLCRPCRVQQLLTSRSKSTGIGFDPTGASGKWRKFELTTIAINDMEVARETFHYEQ